MKLCTLLVAYRENGIWTQNIGVVTPLPQDGVLPVSGGVVPPQYVGPPQKYGAVQKPNLEQLLKNKFYFIFATKIGFRGWGIDFLHFFLIF